MASRACWSPGGCALCPSFLFKAKKAAQIAPPPVVPTVPRLVEDVVPDDRDDPEIIQNTTTVSALPAA